MKIEAATRLKSVLAEEQSTAYPKLTTLKRLRITRVYRSESPDSFYKGKTVWGKGKYFSLSREDCAKISTDPDSIVEYVAKPSLPVLEFDLTYQNQQRSKEDFKALHGLLEQAQEQGKDLSQLLEPQGVHGLVIRSNSMQYAYSQLVVFPQGQH